jgi:hypothetical protein
LKEKQIIEKKGIRKSGHPLTLPLSPSRGEGKGEGGERKL